MRKSGNFVKVRRIYVNKYYELLRKKEEEKEFYMVCQDTGLENEEYHSLKIDLKKKGGNLFKFMNQHSAFANLWDIFGGGTFCVEWGGIEDFEKKKKYLEERGCVVLCVLNRNSFHYNSEVVNVKGKVLDRRKRLLMGLKKKVTELYRIKLKWDANLSSIKKASAKAG